MTMPAIDLTTADAAGGVVDAPDAAELPRALPAVDAWTRTLALLVLAASDAILADQLRAEDVAAGTPRLLLRALHAWPTLADELGAEAACVAREARHPGPSARWLARVLDDLPEADPFAHHLLLLQGRRALRDVLAARAERPAPTSRERRRVTRDAWDAALAEVADRRSTDARNAEPRSSAA